jgi:hypothetical protein
MDALSDVLRAVPLTGAIFFDVHASEPWVAETPAGRSIVGTMFPGGEHFISYHVITRGACWGGVLDDPPMRLAAGDIIVFLHGDAHVMSSAPGMRSTPDIALYRPPSDGQLPFTLSMGSTHADPTRFVCGFLGCDARPFNPLLAALPRVIHVSDRAGGAIGAFVQFAVAESKEPRIGGECVLGHLAVGARGALHGVAGPAGDAVPDELADAACRESSAERHGQRRGHRRSGRLRVGGRVQPCVQEGSGHASKRVAEAPPVYRAGPGVAGMAKMNHEVHFLGVLPPEDHAERSLLRDPNRRTGRRRLGLGGIERSDVDLHFFRVGFVREICEETAIGREAALGHIVVFAQPFNRLPVQGLLISAKRHHRTGGPVATAAISLDETRRRRFAGRRTGGHRDGTGLTRLASAAHP